ncbi:hypothetical protein [Yoonia sp.]|jgi:Flp pilus assembly pilin Flp|uniref:Flp family type IVb pilin n=1 Tax=Yoonia sp. TaxID=2212373 RepID=UPI0025F6594D|nr:hypothetical protein [Yoonia sp.]
MQKLLLNFHKDESGAVTVDFVILTAALVLLGFLIMALVGGAAQNNADWLKTTMENQATP